MKNRCLNPNEPSYSNYGGRGIRICDRWLSFENFRADMGDPPPRATLDRIDVNGDYAPENCRWASKSRQSRNTRRTRFETYQGEKMSLADWSERLRIPYTVLIHRLRRGKTFTEVVDMGWQSDIHDEQRIRAALAAVQGIPTDQLEEGLLTALQLKLSSYALEVDALKEQVARLHEAACQQGG